ncbi:hypothetical protein GQ53DRAFT_779943 [Thozetella sp. PMI_491]|nr:hypothetical protein GQ53DRAFT_779943 [Thozetella sp. PMI_491]
MESFVGLLVPALAAVGALLVLYVVERTVDFLLFQFVLPSKPLERYRRPGSQPTYALHGFGVILLGRNAAKLDAAAEQLRDALALSSAAKGASPAERSAYVRTMVLDPQTAKPAEIEAAVRRTIIGQGPCVSILVNNVGSMTSRTIDLNARFMAHLTTQMIPILIHDRARSLILNLSSAARMGLPHQVVYASTKAFNATFSVGLSRELGANPATKQFDVLAIIAGDIKSQNNIAGLLPGSPDSDDYGRYIVERVDGAVRRGLREISAFWQHDLSIRVASVIPEWMIAKAFLDIMATKRNNINEATKPKDPAVKSSM